MKAMIKNIVVRIKNYLREILKDELEALDAFYRQYV